jgi:hypothetical protein
VSIGPASCFSRDLILRRCTGCGGLAILLVFLTFVATATSQTAPYSVSDVEKLAKQGTEEHGFLESVKQHGISFAPTVEVMQELKASHVPDSVLKEIWAHIPQGRAPEFYLNEGDGLLKNGFYTEATAYYQRVLVLVPGDPTATARLKQAEEEQQKSEAAANERRQKQEAETELRTRQDSERPNLSYYRQEFDASLQKTNCEGAFYYAHRIFFVGPDQSVKAAFEKGCRPYSLTLEKGAPVTLAFQRDLKGSEEHSGERVDFTVVDPIVVNGLLVVPNGGQAWGTVAKSEGGRTLKRVGQIKITVEGMWLADGEKCSLATAEDYRGETKSKKAKTGILIGTVATAGLPIPFLIHGHGKDAKIDAGTKVTVRVAEKMNLDPARFELSGPAPPGPPIKLPPSGLNVVSFQNQSGTDAVVRLVGPSAKSFTVQDGQKFGAHVAAGGYYLLVCFGKSSSEYLFYKSEPFAVTENSDQHSDVQITLRRPKADNPKAREEFYKGQ